MTNKKRYIKAVLTVSLISISITLYVINIKKTNQIKNYESTIELKESYIRELEAKKNDLIKEVDTLTDTLEQLYKSDKE